MRSDTSEENSFIVFQGDYILDTGTLMKVSLAVEQHGLRNHCVWDFKASKMTITDLGSRGSFPMWGSFSDS